MNTIFIGGSRHVSRLPDEIKERLDKVVASRHQVIVGDASGADKAVQKYLLECSYDRVTVFCSGNKPRNNLGSWRVQQVEASGSAKGFQFYAAKDREMARWAHFGLMIWDGKSPGTMLNVLRLLRERKVSVLFSVPTRTTTTFRSFKQWRDFLSECGPSLRSDLQERSTPEEWASVEGVEQPDLPALSEEPSHISSPEQAEKSASLAVLNQALASCDATRIMATLGAIARERGMTNVARETGLARESLYRSLDASGNPEFATIMKVLSSVGLRLEARVLEPSAPPTPAE